MEAESRHLIIGIDITKHPYFHLHGEDEHGAIKVKKELLRTEMDTYFANLFPCTIGFLLDDESASIVNFWRKKLESYNHQVVPMRWEYVMACGGQERDARTICKAARRTVLFNG